ncbi:SWI/SNF COMPLEX-RELATED [Salix viminalis]|uniref:SWI/SNF COMPLEX-RELATED n=1 Tax=Salix viminalis TaxID=40686 RepID=A0A9Q0NKI0_SALVM|nr:SWI/SNF COMPLEX-RELATED [Salix viminalis]
MDSVIMRVREQLDRSRQRLYQERAQIIASRLGLPPSSRAVPPSLPANRIAKCISEASNGHDCPKATDNKTNGCFGSHSWHFSVHNNYSRKFNSVFWSGQTFFSWDKVVVPWNACE